MPTTQENWEKSLGEVFLEEQKVFRPRESIANAEPIKVFVRELLIRAKERGIQQGKREAWAEIKAIWDGNIPQAFKGDKKVERAYLCGALLYHTEIIDKLAQLSNPSKE